MTKHQRVSKICQELGVDLFKFEHLDALVRVCDAYAIMPETLAESPNWVFDSDGDRIIVVKCNSPDKIDWNKVL